MPLYFAYGANMDREGMAKRCPASKPLGLARLARHRFVVTVDGYASVVRDPRLSVHGVVWDLALADIPALDRYEGVARGLYAKIVTSVITAAGPRRALVYTATGKHPGRPKPGYMESVIASAQAFGLPEAYIASLSVWLAEGRAGTAPDLAPLAASPKITPRAHAPVSTVSHSRQPKR
ncbi:MAG: gamma-glutamylcyclotransferase family protein [Beijerinckiaceae bacterium]